MLWSLASKTNSKICVMCRFWYDPTWSALKPYIGDSYKYDSNARKECSQHGNNIMPAYHTCADFQSKI